MSKWPSRIVDPDHDVMKFSISEISNDDISGKGRPIDFVFDSSVGFSAKYALLVINFKSK